MLYTKWSATNIVSSDTYPIVSKSSNCTYLLVVPVYESVFIDSLELSFFKQALFCKPEMMCASSCHRKILN